MSQVAWKISNNEPSERTQALQRLQAGTTGHVVCERGNTWLQAYRLGDDDRYHCELVLQAQEPGRRVFAVPEGVNATELIDIYDRFAGGEDFSFVEREWESLTAVEYRHRHHVLWFVLLAIAAALCVMLAYQHGLLQ